MIFLENNSVEASYLFNYENSRPNNFFCGIFYFTYV